MIDAWTKAGEAKSVGLLGNAADIFPELVRRGIRPDIVTDQTSAHDPVHGYLPQGWSVAQWRDRQESDPKAVEAAARASMKDHVKAMVDFWNAGVPTLDYGNNIRQVAPRTRGWRTPSPFPASCPPTSGRCFAGASARSAGAPCRATRRTSTRPTRR
jgi:urocanate hydratase